MSRARLEVSDQALAQTAALVAAAVAGVKRLHTAHMVTRGRSAVEITRTESAVLLSLRLVASNSVPVLTTVMTMQQSVMRELLRLTGTSVEVRVDVVDLEPA